MEKVLIISYFFPPANFTASSRIDAWVKYLPEHGIKPFVISRNWENKPSSYKELAQDSGTNNLIVNQLESQIHYVKFKGVLRDKLFSKHGNSKFNFLRKVLSLLELFFQNFYFFHPVYLQMFKEAEILIKTEKIEKIIVSANPFVQFRISYLLKKKFPHVKWIADYRDDWTTSEIEPKKGIFKLINNLETFSEKRWLSNASSFFSVSPYYVHKISKLINKKGQVLFNGYDKELLSYKHQENLDEFRITYNGSLYPTQEIEIFLSAFKAIIDKYSKKFKIKLFLPGLEANKSQSERVQKTLKGYEKYFKSSDRIPKKEVIDIQLKSDVLLMVAHKNIKGIPSSKIFEYIGLRKNILLCPSDNDILKDIVSDVSLGTVCETQDNCESYLATKIKAKFEKMEVNEVRTEEIEKYSAKGQVKYLAEVIKSL